MSEELSAPCREKYWSELNESEQIERLRKQLKFVSKQIGELQQVVHLLNNHSHDQGRITVPFDGNLKTLITSNWSHQAPGDDVYF